MIQKKTFSIVVLESAGKGAFPVLWHENSYFNAERNKQHS
jgi:hypothetical protein